LKKWKAVGEGLVSYGQTYSEAAKQSQSFIMKFSAFPSKIAAALERSRKDTPKSDLATIAKISKAGADANKCCTILIKDANYVAEELLELKDMASASDRLLRSKLVLSIAATFPDKDVNVREAFRLYADQWKIDFKSKPFAISGH